MKEKSPRLSRKSLPALVAEWIESDIRTSVIEGALPGYRTLASRYDVSWGTVIEALKLLEQRGVVSAPKTGKPRSVVAAATTPDPEVESLLIISNSVFAGESDSSKLIREIELFWRGSKGLVRWKVVDLTRARSPSRQLQGMIKRYQATALLLCVAPATWIRAALSTGLPLYLLGGEIMEFEKVTGSGFRLATGIKASIRHLRELGHERILVPTEPFCAEMRASVMMGMSHGFEGLMSDAELEPWCPVFKEFVPSVWQSYWDKSFAKLAPTAVVLISEPFVLSCYGFCARRDLAIPKDLSIIGLCTSEFLQWLFPQPSVMDYPLAKSLEHFKRWARSGFRPSPFKLIALEKITGESVRPHSREIP